MRMLEGFQPLKFQQFDGKGNPKKHVAQFVETCNNVVTYGDLLVKKFCASLKDMHSFGTPIFHPTLLIVGNTLSMSSLIDSIALIELLAW